MDIFKNTDIQIQPFRTHTNNCYINVVDPFNAAKEPQKSGVCHALLPFVFERVILKVIFHSLYKTQRKISSSCHEDKVHPASYEMGIGGSIH
jgi:hypothetical protein